MATLGTIALIALLIGFRLLCPPVPAFYRKHMQAHNPRALHDFHRRRGDRGFPFQALADSGGKPNFPVLESDGTSHHDIMML